MILSIEAISKDFNNSKPDDCKNELLKLKFTSNKGTTRKLVNFQDFADTTHKAEFEGYQGHIRLEDKIPYHGANGRLTYDLHDKNWITHIRINNPSNCKAETKIKETKK